ncbi:MAG: glycosyltransferase family 2 protein [Thomasclavelia sp.]
MQKLVSVIIPVYNIEKFISKCVKSVLENTYRNIEIILVDDGSTDSSGKICDKFSKNYRNVATIHKTNGGLSSARNEGIKNSNGDYILFVDGDDTLNDEAITMLVNAAAKTNSDVIQMNYEMVNKDGAILGMKQSINTTYLGKNNILNAFFINDYINVTAWGKLYKKEIFDSVSFYVGKNNEDTIFLADLFEIINSYTCIDYIGYQYLYRNNSITKTSFNEKKMDAIFATEYFFVKCKKLWPKYKSYASLQICKVCFYTYCNYINSNYLNKDIEKEILNKNRIYYKLVYKDKIIISNVNKIRLLLFRYLPKVSVKLQNIYTCGCKRRI